jgi:hypothetical protein
MTRQENTRQDKARRDKARQDKTRQSNARQDKARGKARQDKTKEDKAREDKAKEDKTSQDKTICKARQEHTHTTRHHASATNRNRQLHFWPFNCLIFIFILFGYYDKFRTKDTDGRMGKKAKKLRPSSSMIQIVDLDLKNIRLKSDKNDCGLTL